jgi:hypothetical protein
MIARRVTLMAMRSGSCQVFALAAGGGVVVTSRAWAGALLALSGLLIAAAGALVPASRVARIRTALRAE